MPNLGVHHRQQRLPDTRVQARRLAQQRHMPIHMALPRNMPVYQTPQRHIALRDNPNRRATLRNHKTPRIPIPHQRRRVSHRGIYINHRNIVAHQIRRVHNRPFRLDHAPCFAFLCAPSIHNIPLHCEPHHNHCPMFSIAPTNTDAAPIAALRPLPTPRQRPANAISAARDCPTIAPNHPRKRPMPPAQRLNCD